jgi:hypothetical protein
MSVLYYVNLEQLYLKDMLAFVVYFILLLLLLLLTVIQCKQRYIRTSLPCNVTVVDLK